MYLTSFIGVLNTALAQRTASFCFPYNQKVWHLVECLKRNGLVRYYTVEKHHDSISLRIYLSYSTIYRNQPVFSTIRFYARFNMTSQDLIEFHNKQQSRLRPLLIGWNSHGQTFCSSSDLLLQTNSSYGFQKPILILS